MHTNCFTTCVVDTAAKQTFRDYKLSEVAEFAASLRETDQVAVEATGNTRYFYEQVAAKVKRVAVVNPRAFEIVKRSANKTDKREHSCDLLRFQFPLN